MEMVEKRCEGAEGVAGGGNEADWPRFIEATRAGFREATP
jgi:hypothetical protein